MTLYEELYQNLNSLKSFYRFEGYISKSYYDLRNQNLLKCSNNYIYFSQTIAHHFYFIAKRLEQLLQQEILKNTSLNLNTTTLRKIDAYHTILDFIENYKLSNPLYSLEIRFCSKFLELLKGNIVRNVSKKNNMKQAELVDVGIKGGGFGLSADWLHLFELLTIIYSYQQITNENLIDFLKIYRLNKIDKHCSLNPTLFLLEKKYQRFIPNYAVLQNDFAKYDIVDTMENLLDSGAVNPNSPFGKNPTETIRSTVRHYERTRSKTLQNLNTLYNKYE